MQGWMRRKDIDQVTVHEEGRRLVPTLSWPHLVALGIGAIVGTGIYTLIGVGANLAGPAVLLSFLVAGIVCACAALAYAEMATMMPAAGSAYTYSYAVLGETIAWIVGWSLILEYTLVVSTVAVGWSGYFVGFLDGLGVHLPQALTVGPHAGGLINLPAILITFVVAGLLIAGTRESATLNAFLVVAKLIALAVFVAIALPAFDASHLQPFMPHGFAESVGPDGKKYGVMAAAAIIFFAFYGFDAISTAAEETKNPGRDLSIGIVGSMIGCTLIYMLVALAAVGAMSYTVFGQSPEPLALIMRELGHGAAAKIVSAVLIVAMVATTFTTQRQLTRKNMPKSALEGPMARQQQMIMYALPFVFVITGPNFPVGVLIYWTTTNLWTMGQQYYVIKRNPTPGSEAEALYLEKKAAKEQARAIKRGETTLEQIEAEKQAEIEAARGQRQQPKKGAPRAKRAGGPKPAESTAIVPEPEGELEAIAEPEETISPAAPTPTKGSGQRNQPKKKR